MVGAHINIDPWHLRWSASHSQTRCPTSPRPSQPAWVVEKFDEPFSFPILYAIQKYAKIRIVTAAEACYTLL